jgi:hypothetical protein
VRASAASARTRGTRRCHRSRAHRQRNCCTDCSPPALGGGMRGRGSRGRSPSSGLVVRTCCASRGTQHLAPCCPYVHCHGRRGVLLGARVPPRLVFVTGRAAARGVAWMSLNRRAVLPGDGRWPARAAELGAWSERAVGRGPSCSTIPEPLRALARMSSRSRALSGELARDRAQDTTSRGKRHRLVRCLAGLPAAGSQGRGACSAASRSARFAPRD